MRKSLLILGAVLPWAAMPVPLSAEARPEILFELSFDRDFFAASPAGQVQPTHPALAPTLVPGIRGQAARFQEGTQLRYLSAGNLNKAAGTFAAWIQIPEESDNFKGGNYTLLKEEGPSSTEATNLWAWFLGGYALRFDVQRYAIVPRATLWRKDEWHHVAFAWDQKSGTKIYVDGRLAARSFLQWNGSRNEAFLIGAADATGRASWNAAIDEVVIFGRELTPEEVRTEYRRVASFAPRLAIGDPFVTEKRRDSVRLEISNDDDQPTRVDALQYVLTDKDRKRVSDGKVKGEEVAALSTIEASIPIEVPAAGEYQLTVSGKSGNRTISVSRKVIALAAQVTPHGPAALVPSVEIDLAAQAPFTERGASAVIKSVLGDYRQAGSQRHDRFAYEIEVKELNVPYVAVVTYPDDKPRTMEVLLQHGSEQTGEKSYTQGIFVRDYQAQTGIYTGHEYPVSGKNREHRFVFWPRTNRLALIFMTAEEGQPAAVKSVAIYRTEQVPALPGITPFKGSVPARSAGIYYEDPSLTNNFGATPDVKGWMTAVDRLLDYMQSFGQDTLNYPLVWYNGPIYNSRVEPVTIAGPSGVRPHADGYPRLLLRSLEARGMRFNASLQIHQLASLADRYITEQNRDQTAIPTILNRQGTGGLHYNRWHGADPGVNPIDPQVLAGVKNVAGEIVDRYGREPAFAGITLVMAQAKLFTFGSILSGYNEQNLAAFQQETGVKIPGTQTDNQTMVAESYRWLMTQPDAREAWITWRCQKLHEHYQAISRRMAAVRSDLKLTLDIFLSRKDYDRLSSYRDEPALATLREIGIDPRLYAGDRNIVIGYTYVPAELRWSKSRTKTKASVNIVKQMYSNRTVMVAPEIVSSIRETPVQTEVVLHDRYWEDDIGRVAPLTDLVPRGITETVWRVSTLNPAGPYALEGYVAALNNLDASTITKGGYLIGTYGTEAEVGDFTRAFRTLPAVRFDDVPGADDPVRMRQAVVDGKWFAYLLNRTDQPIEVHVSLDRAAAVVDLVAGTSGPARNEMVVTLPAYGLRTFRSGDAGVRAVKVAASVADTWLQPLRDEIEGLRSQATPDSRAVRGLARAEELWGQEKYVGVKLLLDEEWAIELRKAAHRAAK